MTKTRIEQARSFDVLIIGGGPAGLSAGLWCADLGMRACIVERARECGGQLLRVYGPVTNYIGVTAADGRELRNRFMRSVEGANVEIVTRTAIASADLSSKTLTLEQGAPFVSRAIIIAAGVRRRELDIPGEHEFYGRGILESGTLEARVVKGKRVAIIGGGDAALENALILSEQADSVFVLHRGSKFSARPNFFEKARVHPKIHLMTGTRATAISGGETVAFIDIETSGTPTSLKVDHVLVRVGVRPNTELFDGQIDMDSNGYIRVDQYCETSMRNIFAVGDVANPKAPTIATAAGTGAAAAKMIHSRLAA